MINSTIRHWLALLLLTSATLSCAGTAGELTPQEATTAALTAPLLEGIAPPAFAARQPIVTPLSPDAAAEAAAAAAEPKVPLDKIEIKATTRVFAEPRRAAPVLGVIIRGARVARTGSAESDAGCKLGWTQIAPRGWVCADTSTTDETLTTTMLPRLDRRRAVPGTSGVVRDGRTIFADHAAAVAGKGDDGSGRRVRMASTVRIGDVIYWETADGELVAARDVRRSRGSSFEGVFVDAASELRLPVAFAHKAGARGADVPIYDEPGGRRIGALEPREAVNIIHTTHNGRWLQLEGDGWIAGRDARVADKAAPPRTVGAKEVWLDFNRDRQVIVVYRGKEPVYTTLTSSGKYGHRTPVGVYRVEKKIAKTTMSSRPDADEPYVVKNVPWTLFFHHGFAVHGAYWHNKFGTPVSHGCMNLAPTDAKVVYELLGPEVPAGWSVVTATDEEPGAVVRVKTDAKMTPPLRGSAETYAARLDEERTALASK